MSRPIYDKTKGDDTIRYVVKLPHSGEGVNASAPRLPGGHLQGADETEAMEEIANAIIAYFKVRDGLTGEGEIGTVAIRVVEVAFGKYQSKAAVA